VLDVRHQVAGKLPISVEHQIDRPGQRGVLLRSRWVIGWMVAHPYQLAGILAARGRSYNFASIPGWLATRYRSWPRLRARLPRPAGWTYAWNHGTPSRLIPARLNLAGVRDELESRFDCKEQRFIVVGAGCTPARRPGILPAAVSACGMSLVRAAKVPQRRKKRGVWGVFGQLHSQPQQAIAHNRQSCQVQLDSLDISPIQRVGHGQEGGFVGVFAALRPAEGVQIALWVCERPAGCLPPVPITRPSSGCNQADQRGCQCVNRLAGIGLPATVAGGQPGKPAGQRLPRPACPRGLWFASAFCNAASAVSTARLRRFPPAAPSRRHPPGRSPAARRAARTSQAHPGRVSRC
jgi:hypothetical protein